MFSDRMRDVPKSFIREILKVTVDPTIISFAGGLPNRNLFPLKEIQEATNKVFEDGGSDVLQYSTSEGYFPLREWIAGRYKKRFNIAVAPEEILVLNGSQQGMDLLGKIFLNDGDPVILEEPSYLGAIQAFSLYTSNFRTIPLKDTGIDTRVLKKALSETSAKLFYCIPNFQNPSGISYNRETREETAEIIGGSGTLLIEDDPYGELRFYGEEKPSFRKLLGEQCVLLGTFSKIVVPSLRIGWIVAPSAIIDKVLTAKQAADLHTNYLGQRIIHQFLLDNSIDRHIEKISAYYKILRDRMISSIKSHFPPEATCTEPEGGMFVWVTLPKQIKAMEVFEKALAQKVIFVPGEPFFTGREPTHSMRLNFTCMDEDMIEEGIKRLGKTLKAALVSA